MSVDVWAIYKVPGGLALDSSCSGFTTAAQIGGLSCQVTLPRVRWESDRPDVIPPDDFVALPEKAQKRLVLWAGRDGFWWGKAYQRNSEERRVEAWSCTSVLLHVVVSGSEVTYSTSSDNSRGHPQGQPVDQLFGGVDQWALSLRQWIEVLADQDMRLHGALSLSQMTGEGLCLVAIEEEGVSTPLGAHHVTIQLGRAEVLSSNVLQRAIDQASGSSEPSEEAVLLADARAAFRRERYRRAVIDAATAVELALTEALPSQLAPLGQPLADTLRNKFENRPLGVLVEILTDTLGLDNQLQHALVRSRNKAVHEGTPPLREEARAAVELAEQTVRSVKSSLGSSYP